MRTAAICPTCATYTNALCIIYNGTYLSNINVSPLDNLQTALANINTVTGVITTNITNIQQSVTNINNKYQPLHGIGYPTLNASFIGQTYVDVGTHQLYFAYQTGHGVSDWQATCNCIPLSMRLFDYTFDYTFN